MSWLTKHRTPIPAVIPAVAPDGGGSLPDLGRVPVLDTRHGWVHDRAASVAGRVVLHQIWTFGCHNCTNTLPAMRAIWDRYAPEGLVMVGIHTPEFPREADPAAVAAAVDRLDVRWPVLLDPEWINWKAFANRYWPHTFLSDETGTLRFDHVGEGGYDRIEDAVRTLLGVETAAVRAAVQR